MRQYSIMQPLYLSFFSRDLYRDVRANWKGTGFFYLLLLLAITWLPVMYKFHRDLSEVIRLEAPKYIEQVPKMTIVRGEVSLDKPVPYTISNPDSNEPLLVIDTSGKITSFEQTKAHVILTRDKLMYRESNRPETRIYDLSGIDDLTIDRDSVNGLVQVVGKYFATVAYPFALGVSFVYRIILMLIYAAIGMIFANVLKTQLDYQTMLRLASVSITPVIILTTLKTLIGFSVPVFGLVCFAIAMGYLLFAVKANAEPARPGAPVT